MSTIFCTAKYYPLQWYKVSLTTEHFIDFQKWNPTTNQYQLLKNLWTTVKWHRNQGREISFGAKISTLFSQGRINSCFDIECIILQIQWERLKYILQINKICSVYRKTTHSSLVNSNRRCRNAFIALLPIVSLAAKTLQGYLAQTGGNLCTIQHVSLCPDNKKHNIQQLNGVFNS